MLGIGSIIGAGIFVIAGTAAAEHAGPAVLISFVIAGLGCLFAGLCYAEFASMIPESGSAYTYAYATMGRFMAWFIGWNMVLEYLVSARRSRSAGRAISSASCRNSAYNLSAALSPTRRSPGPPGFHDHYI
jgi:L-asparagine transporter-like permease